MSQAKPTEIRALSGARAIPPIILVLFHYCEGHGYRGAPWFDLLAAKGYLWVEFFFALSGFVLFHVYGTRVREFWQGRAFIPFLRARLIRLYPLHFFMLLLIVVQIVVLRALANAGGYVSIYDQPWHPIFNTPSFIANLFLVQAWNLFNYLSWNGVAWFVSVEFLLCLLFPFYLLIAAGRAWRGLLLCGLGVAGLTILNHNSVHGLDLTFHNGIYRGMSAFAVGIGLSVIFGAVRRAGRKPLPETAHSLAQLLVLGALLYAIYETGWSHSHRDILTVLPMMVLVFALAFDRGVLANLLKTPIPMKVGEWSYAIYIGQTAWLQLLHFIEQRIYPPDSTVVLGYRWPDLIHWLEPAALVAVCIAWGAFLAIALEQPASNFLKRFFDAVRPGTTPAIHPG